MPSTASLFGLPSAVLRAIVTRGVFLIRLVFHDPSSVITKSLSPSGTPQIGVGLGRPSLVNVVKSRYLDLMTSWKLGATLFSSGRWKSGGKYPRPHFPKRGDHHVRRKSSSRLR